jgi:hypothetical protein
MIGLVFMLPFVLQVSNAMAEVPHEHITINEAAEKTFGEHRR